MDLTLLETLSEYLAKVIFWWIHLVDGISEDKLPVYTYAGCSVVVLLLLVLVLRIFPKSLRGIIWIISAAILLTPGDTLGSTGQVAPAIIGVLHGFLMGDHARAINALLPIIAMIIVGLIVGAIWQMLRAMIEKTLIKNKDNTHSSTPSANA